MKQFLLLLFILLHYTGLSQNTSQLEMQLETSIQEMMQAEHRLDSLNHTLDYWTNLLEKDISAAENNQTRQAEWYQKLKQLSESIELQKMELNELQGELSAIKSDLAKSYSRGIDSLNQTLSNTTDLKKREEIQKQIYVLSEKRLLMLPKFKSFSFDPHKIVEIDLHNSKDSLEEAIYRDYLNNARSEIIVTLHNLQNMRKEIEELIYLKERGNRFLEDMDDNRPLILSSQSFSERTATFSGFNQTDIFSNLPQAESLINIMEQFQPEYFPEQKFNWTSPVDSGKVTLTLDEYQKILLRAEDILEGYLDFLNQKIRP